jgi:hypothetical protein
MRLAYCDPPYLGQGHRYPENVEVNHPLLIQHLVDDYPDGWALSCSSPSLKYMLNLCPDDVRVGVWVKPFASFKPNVNPAYAWEPVIFRGGRKRTREQLTLRDWCSESITFKRGVVGAKPKEFCFWVFQWLNVQPGDTFDDIFPGSGAVSHALELWRATPRMGALL